MVDILVGNRADFSKRKICENWSKTNTQHLLNAEKILNYDGKKSPGKKIMQTIQILKNACQNTVAMEMSNFLFKGESYSIAAK